MSETKPRGLPAREPPPTGRGLARWLASEWGLAALALVLAVLVWAVVWGNISQPMEISVEVEPRASAGFVAYAEGPLVLKLEGPRAELEAARTRLGSRVVVPLGDLSATQDKDRIRIVDVDQLSLPFPRRLVTGVVQTTSVEVIRWDDSVPVRFEKPAILGVPEGFRCEVMLDPATHVLGAPAGKVEGVIAPDPIDVNHLFEEDPSGFLPEPDEMEVSFKAWRNDPDQRRYRAAIALPKVRARLRFRAEEEGRVLRNRIEIRHPPGYVVTPSGTDHPEVLQGYFTGTFQGAEKDLDKLAANLDAWWFVVRIPPEKLPAEEEEITDDFPVELARVQTDAIGGLRVRFVAGPTLLVVIRRE